MFLFLGLSISASLLFAEPGDQLKAIQVNGVELHYLEAGEGVPVIFVHGGLVDYRRWLPQIKPFSEQYRVIAYSRRYNFPNTNKLEGDHSALVEAQDLAAFVEALNLPPVHIIGESYGAYTALLLAIEHPELVRTVILAETPLMDWLKQIPAGKEHYDDFMNNLWFRLGEAFNRNDDDQAIAVVWKYFVGAEPSIPPDVAMLFKQNLLEWKALNASRDPFPDISEAAVRKMNKPVLMMTGENTLQLFKVLEPKVESVLTNVKRVIVPKASHEMWDEYPEECRNIAITFLARH